MLPFEWRPGAVFLGAAWDDAGEEYDAGLHDDRHLFFVAGSRSGKGRSLLAPNAASWPGGLVAVDLKGELASIAATRRGRRELAQNAGSSVRHFLGQPVGILDPMGVVRGPARIHRVSYDPLADFRIDDRDALKRIETISEGLVLQETGNAAHFTESAETLLKGAIELIKVSYPPERQCLTAVRGLLLLGFEGLKNQLRTVRTRAGLAQEAASILEQVGADEGGGFFTTLSRQLKWMADPDMQDHLRPSGFSLWRTVREGGSVFIVLPPEDVPTQKRWIRLMVNIALHAKARRSVLENTGPATLFILDEMPVLGHFKLIEETAGYMAGYGVKLVSVIQNIGQLRRDYKDNWETFLGNAGAICAFGLNDLATEEYISHRIGKKKTYNSDRADNRNWSLHPTLRPEEVRELTARETMNMIVIPARGGWMQIRRRNYDHLIGEWGPVFESPEYIRMWESARLEHARRQMHGEKWRK